MTCLNKNNANARDPSTVTDLEEENHAFVTTDGISLSHAETVDDFALKLIDDGVDLCRTEANAVGIQCAIARRRKGTTWTSPKR